MQSDLMGYYALGLKNILSITGDPPKLGNYPDATADRHRGIDLLESLGCVLPDAEIEYLGIDREAHHARAAEARTKHESELQQ